MIEKDILQTFLDLKNPINKEWLELIKSSIQFTPKEKAMFIIDFRYYKPEQIDKFVRALQAAQERDKELKEKFPEEYKKRIDWFKSGWDNMLLYLEEVLLENKIKQGQKMDDDQISDLRNKIQDNF